MANLSGWTIWSVEPLRSADTRSSGLETRQRGSEHSQTEGYIQDERGRRIRRGPWTSIDNHRGADKAPSTRSKFDQKVRKLERPGRPSERRVAPLFASSPYLRAERAQGPCYACPRQPQLSCQFLPGKYITSRLLLMFSPPRLSTASLPRNVLQNAKHLELMLKY